MRSPASTLVLGLIALCAAACSERGPAVVPTESPGIAGSITAIDRGGERVGSIRVEVNPAQSSGSAKAIVSIGQATAVLTPAAEQRDFNALRVGQTVRVWFTGPVAESYPVRGAGRIVVIDVP
jgi:Protein of unknown function (DUF3221)